MVALSWTYRLPNLSKEQFSEIGKLIVWWSYLEESINNLLGLSLDLNHRQSLALTLAMRSFNGRVQALYDIWYQTNHNVAEKKLKPIKTELIRLYTVRNKFAHRPWWSHTNEDLHSFKLDPKQLPFHPADEWKVNEIIQASADIEKVLISLQNFSDENGAINSPSHGKPSPPSHEGK